MKPRRHYQAVVPGSQKKATPAGSKQVVEGFAAWLSANGEERVCIERVDTAGSPAEATGVCYVGGLRQKRRLPRAPSPALPIVPNLPDAPNEDL